MRSAFNTNSSNRNPNFSNRKLKYPEPQYAAINFPTEAQLQGGLGLDEDWVEDEEDEIVEFKNLHYKENEPGIFDGFWGTMFGGTSMDSVENQERLRESLREVKSSNGRSSGSGKKKKIRV